MKLPPGSIQQLGLIALGGVLAYFWNPAALAISAWGVYGSVLTAHDSIIRHTIALNDSLIELDKDLADEAKGLERLIRFGPNNS